MVPVTNMEKTFLHLALAVWTLIGVQNLYAQPVFRVNILNDTSTVEMKNEHDIRVTHRSNQYLVEFNIRDGKRTGSRSMTFGTTKQFEYAMYQWRSGRTVILDFAGRNPDEKFHLKLVGHHKCCHTMIFDPEELNP